MDDYAAEGGFNGFQRGDIHCSSLIQTDAGWIAAVFNATLETTAQIYGLIDRLGCNRAWRINNRAREGDLTVP